MYLLDNYIDYYIVKYNNLPFANPYFMDFKALFGYNILYKEKDSTMKLNKKQTQLFKVIDDIYKYITFPIRKALPTFRKTFKLFKSKASYCHSELIINGKRKAKVLKLLRASDFKSQYYYGLKRMLKELQLETSSIKYYKSMG